jgi:hypothetical protein
VNSGVGGGGEDGNRVKGEGVGGGGNKLFFHEIHSAHFSRISSNLSTASLKLMFPRPCV